MLEEGVRVTSGAVVAGKVAMRAPARVDEGAVLRGDQASIEVGARFFIGARSSVHVEVGTGTRVGEGVWVGADAVVHAAEVGDGVRIEDGALVLSHSSLGAGSIVAADSLVPEGVAFPENSYISGTPGRRLRDTTPEERAETRALLTRSLDPGLP